MRVLLLIVALSVGTSGCLANVTKLGGSNSGEAEEWPALDWPTASRSGHRLARIENPAGILFKWNWTSVLDLDDLNPQRLIFVEPNGNVSNVWGATEYDNAHFVTGDGVIYAGVADEGTQAPPVMLTADAPKSRVSVFQSNATEGLLVLAWADITPPLTFNASFIPGTVLTDLGGNDEGHAVELKDFRGGLRFGTPAVSTSVQESLLFPTKGGQVLLLGRLYRSDASEGTLKITRGNDARSVPLRGERDGNNPTCCFDDDSLIVTSKDDLRLEVLQAGNSRNGKVLLLVVRLDGPSLPDVFIKRLNP